MAIPEQQPAPDAQVREIPEQAEIPVQVEQATGVHSIPVAPQPVINGAATLAQPVPAPKSNKKTVTIPARSQEDLLQMSKGKAEDSQTWFGVFWLYKIKKALKNGLDVLFGGDNT